MWQAKVRAAARSVMAQVSQNPICMIAQALHFCMEAPAAQREVAQHRPRCLRAPGNPINCGKCPHRWHVVKGWRRHVEIFLRKGHFTALNPAAKPRARLAHNHSLNATFKNATSCAANDGGFPPAQKMSLRPISAALKLPPVVTQSSLLEAIAPSYNAVRRRPDGLARLLGF